MEEDVLVQKLDSFERKWSQILNEWEKKWFKSIDFLGKLATDKKFVEGAKPKVDSNVHEDLSTAQITLYTRVSERSQKFYVIFDILGYMFDNICDWLLSAINSASAVSTIIKLSSPIVATIGLEL